MRLRSARLAAAALVAVAATAMVATAAVPASAVPGLTRVYAYTPYDSNSSKEALAQCPAGTRVLGGGGYLIGGTGYVHFTRLQALGSSDRFSAAAAEHFAYGNPWRIYAYAICGQQPSGLVYVSYHTAEDSSGYKSATVTCPAGKKLISAGARTSDGNGQVIIDDVRPSATLTSQTVAAYEDASGYGGQWSLWAHGVCSSPLPGLELRTATTYASGSSTFVFADAHCTAGKRVHGLGGSINGGVGEVTYTGLYPAAGLDSSTAYATHLVPDGPTGNWNARAYAICAY